MREIRHMCCNAVSGSFQLRVVPWVYAHAWVCRQCERRARRWKRLLNLRVLSKKRAIFSRICVEIAFIRSILLTVVGRIPVHSLVLYDCHLCRGRVGVCMNATLEVMSTLLAVDAFRPFFPDYFQFYQESEFTPARLFLTKK